MGDSQQSLGRILEKQRHRQKPHLSIQGRGAGILWQLYLVDPHFSTFSDGSGLWEAAFLLGGSFGENHNRMRYERRQG